MTEDLVTSTCDRLVRCSRHSEQDVGNAVVTDLAGAGEVEASRAIVEQGRIGRPEGERDESVRLMTGGADRVEPEPLRLEPAGCVIDSAAVDLRPPGGARLGWCRCRPRLRHESAQLSEEMLLEWIEVVVHHRDDTAGRRCQRFEPATRRLTRSEWVSG